MPFFLLCYPTLYLEDEILVLQNDSPTAYILDELLHR